MTTEVAKMAAGAGLCPSATNAVVSTAGASSIPSCITTPACGTNYGYNNNYYGSAFDYDVFTFSGMVKDANKVSFLDSLSAGINYQLVQNPIGTFGSLWTMAGVVLGAVNSGANNLADWYENC